MREYTRQAFDGFVKNIARTNQVTAAAVLSKFNVTPSVQQKMESRIQESSDFLKQVNIIGVTEQSGQCLGLGITNPIASTTDTDTKDRATKAPTDLEADSYLCTQTNYDTHIKYQTLDAWAGFPDFQNKVNNAIIQRIALDRMMVGFNGTSRAATSNPTTNPLLQDVNKGWLQKVRDAGAKHYVSQVGATANKVPVGGSAEHKNIDALVYDTVNNLIDPWYRNDTQLVVVLGRKILSDKYFPIINANHAPTEQKAAQDLVVSQQRVGNLQAVSVPFFPEKSILVTRLDNLSIYYQKSGLRRSVLDNPKRDRIETYQSSNDAYVIEDMGGAALIDNIEVAA